jgi:hypothetical protein
VIARISATLAVLITLSGAATASGGTGWKHGSITRRAGTIEATLSYDRKGGAPGSLPETDYRNVTLVVRHDGTIVLNRPLPAPTTGVQTTLAFTLRNVWGSAEPEAVVRTSSCGNRCGEQLAVALVSGSNGRLLLHGFDGGWPGPDSAWQGQRRGATFYFISRDQRFFCEFTDCASSTTPIQVFVIDHAGHRFVDVTRTRGDLVTHDAAGLLTEYQREIRSKQYSTKSRPGYDPMGVLAPWCADEYLLDGADVCHDRLAQALKAGYLQRWTSRTLEAFYKRLVNWGYGR